MCVRNLSLTYYEAPDCYLASKLFSRGAIFICIQYILVYKIDIYMFQINCVLVFLTDLFFETN